MSILDPLAIPSLYATIAIAIIVTIAAIRKKVLFKMGIRNFWKRKGHALIVLGGLMIGTAILAASMITGDTLAYLFVFYTLKELDQTDEYVGAPGPDGSSLYFDESIYTLIANNLSDESKIDGIVPRIIETATVINEDKGRLEPSTTVIGTNATYERNSEFGALTIVDDEQEIYTDILGADEVIINERLADEIKAEVGDVVLIKYVIDNVSDPTNNIPQSRSVTIKYIVKNEGKGNYGAWHIIFMPLTQVQSYFNRTGQINRIMISNDGGPDENIGYSEDVGQKVEAILEDNAIPLLQVTLIKEDQVTAAENQGDAIGDVFLIFGVFSIIAGVMLIINIFVMLAEERKAEIGMARAVGMQRQHVVLMFLFEGIVFAAVASLLGLFAGIGVSYLMVLAMGYIFGAGGEMQFTEVFHMETTSLIAAFCVGFIMTVITVIIASYKASSINIVRAIRDIPEPPKERGDIKMNILALIMMIFGFLIGISGISAKSNTNFIIGFSLFALGLGQVLVWRGAPKRWAYSLTTIIVLALTVSPFEFYPVEGFDPMYIIIVSALAVFSGVILVMVNSDLLLRFTQRLFRPFKKAKAMLMTSISYPMEKRFRTGMTIAMFALVIYTVVMIAMITEFQTSSVETIQKTEVGGYDVLVELQAPVDNFTALIESNPNLSQHELYDITPLSLTYVKVFSEDVKAEDAEFYIVMGIDSSFGENSDFKLETYSDDYDSDEEVFEAVALNSSLAVIDLAMYIAATGGGGPGDAAGSNIVGAELGDVLYIQNVQNASKSVNVTVIGVLSSFSTTGIFIQKAITQSELDGFDNWYLMRTKGDSGDAAGDLEFQMTTYGAVGTDIVELVEIFIQQQSDIMLLFQVFLGMGLLVGVAGLGIVTIRAITERKQQIGMMRAIGFQKKTVFISLMIETSFIAILGIIIGVSLGFGVGVLIWMQGFKDAGYPFVVPWLRIIGISIAAYVTTLIFTYLPARTATKVPPAEALRYD